MPKTSTCPKCEQPITLAEVPEHSLVECPMCQEQFEMTEALDFVAESEEEDDGPPELSVVEVREADLAPDDEPSEAGLAEERQNEEENTEQVPEEPPIQVRCPCCRDSFALEDLLLAETDEPLGPEAASAILADGSTRQSQDGKDHLQFRFGDATDSDDDHSEFRLQAMEERPSSGAFEFTAAAGADSDRKENSEPRPARRRRRESGGMKDMLGAVFGGAAGLLITYYLLNLIGGPRFDMLNVYLPGVTHTAVHRPGWLGGPPEEEFDSGIGDALGMAEEQPEAPPKKPRPSGDKKQQDTSNAEQADAPSATEPTPPEEQTLPPDYAGLINPPQVTSEQLGQALREVDRLAKAGPLGEEGYEAWCRVAEAATFIDPQDGDPQTTNRLIAMRSLVKDLTGADVVKIGQFATRRTVNPDRANCGILLAGTPRKHNTPKGNGFLTGLVVAGTGAQLVIASDHKLPIQPDDRVFVLGYLVDQPKDATQGLDTELPQITWARTVLKFEK